MNYNDMVEYSYGLWGDSTRLNPLGLDLNLLMWANKNSGLDCSILTDGDLEANGKLVLDLVTPI